MEKVVNLALNQFTTTPHSLRAIPAVDAPQSYIAVNLASLYHHYYLDSFGRTPPNPDPAQFEHLQFLLTSKEFRIRGNGIGIAAGIRRHRSNELGQAFCRWFLHDHLNITYFAHMQEVLDRTQHPSFRGFQLERIQAGDTPDYFCAENVDKVFLSEAKGRYSSINFANREFASWRDQFSRVAVKDSLGRTRSLKGFIVATRFSTEMYNPSIKTTIFAEDPKSPGDGPLTADNSRDLGAIVISLHYGGIAIKLGQPILAAALTNGYQVPDEIRFPSTIWEFQAQPLKGKRFVGGYYLSEGGSLPVRQKNGRVIFDSTDPFRLDVGRGTFFGIEENIFRQVAAIARGGIDQSIKLDKFEYIEPFYSGLSVLRDGSIIGPLEFFAPVQQESF